MTPNGNLRSISKRLSQHTYLLLAPGTLHIKACIKPEVNLNGETLTCTFHTPRVGVAIISIMSTQLYCSTTFCQKSLCCTQLRYLPPEGTRAFVQTALRVLTLCLLSLFAQFPSFFPCTHLPSSSLHITFTFFIVICPYYTNSKG